MEKTFIQRLTDKQIRAFLDEKYPKAERYSYYFIERGDDIYVSVNYNMGDSTFNISLREFYTIGVDKTQWVKYLYSIFGEEYKAAYLKRCEQIFY